MRHLLFHTEWTQLSAKCFGLLSNYPAKSCKKLVEKMGRGGGARGQLVTCRPADVTN
jgi:hypothetical protein